MATAEFGTPPHLFASAFPADLPLNVGREGRRSGPGFPRNWTEWSPSFRARADSKPRLDRIAPRPLGGSSGRGLLRGHLDLRMVSRGSSPPLSRSGELATLW